ncbi:MAG: TolC family protein, partial [Gammaproteobacteria bacterium]|nr:TolC family protein [Gammaproteobacteria bacterium]
MSLFTRRKYFLCFDISLLNILLIVFVSALPVSVFAANPLTLSLEKALAMALEPNSGLAEMQSRAAAAAAIPSQQGALPDPRFHLNFANLPVDSFDLAQEPMTQTQLGFSQALPFPGKLGLRASVASSNATVTEHQVGEYRLRLIRDVKLAWWKIFYFDKSLETVEKNRQLLKQIVSTAQTKYSVGQGLQQDVLLAQLELS